MEQHQFGLREWADLCERKDATIAALTQENERLKQGQAIDLKNNNDYREQVAALQARVQELEDGCEMMTHTAGTFQELWRTACDQREAFEQQLTQRTAECDALKLVNDTHMKTVMKLSHVVEQRTAELEAIEKILDIDSGKTTVEKVRDLHHSFKQVWESYQDASNEMFKAQAELERVRAALEDACLSVAVHGEQPPQKWLDALQHRQGMEG